MNRNTEKLNVMVLTTMFDHGGITVYWKDVIALLGSKCVWRFFVNQIPSVDPDPFKSSNVDIRTGLVWNNPLSSSWNLIQDVRIFMPNVLILNGTLAVLRVLPALIILRMFFSGLKIKCIFHNGPIYQHFIKDFINRLIVSAVGGLCHQNIFVSQFVADYWLCAGDVLSRPYRPMPRHDYTPKRTLKVGFLGRISHEKDPELFLCVMDRIRNLVSVEIEMAGVGNLRSKLEDQFPWARWRGWVNARDWLAGIDLLVTTSKTEGWPLAIGEALECGVPVIGIDVGGVGEILGAAPRKWLTRSRNPSVLVSMTLDFIGSYAENASDYFASQANHRLSPSDWALHVVQ
jgi:glycosyltransferase involved in cell wall biosynthesis